MHRATPYYNYHLGTWHSGHNLTLRDILAWHAFSKQLSYDEDWGALGGAYFHPHYANTNRPWFQDVKAIEILDAERGIVTYYGDYTFMADSVICGYYDRFPAHPWQLYEAVSHLKGETEHADSGATIYDRYDWSETSGTNWADLLSKDHTVDFRNTLQNLRDALWLPPYISGPITVGDYEDIEAEIDAITAWQDTYESSWISQGPFKIVLDESHNYIMEMERHGQTDGYPFAEDHWRNKLFVGYTEHGAIEVPTDIQVGQEFEARMRVEVYEEYPVEQNIDLGPEHDYASSFTVYDEFDVPIYMVSEPDLIYDNGSYLRAYLPKNETINWDPGFYTLEFTSCLSVQRTTTVSTTTIVVHEPVFEPEYISLEILPTVGYAPLESIIEINARNHGGLDGDSEVTINGTGVYTLNIPAGESVQDSFTYTFNETGTYIVEFGDLEEEVEVLETPRFTPENLALEVEPLQGDAPLDVNITVRGDNTGKLDGALEIFIDYTMLHIVEIPAEGSVEETLNHTFHEPGEYVIRWGDLERNVTVTEYVPEPIIVNPRVEIDRLDGDAPLEVNITVSAENEGDADDEVILVIQGAEVYTLIIPAQGSAEHTYVHTFQKAGTYQITFHDQTETVVVGEMMDETPTESRLWVLPVVGIVIVLLLLVVYLMKTTGTRPVRTDDEADEHWDETEEEFEETSEL